MLFLFVAHDPSYPSFTHPIAGWEMCVPSEVSGLSPNLMRCQKKTISPEQNDLKEKKDSHSQYTLISKILLGSWDHKISHQLVILNWSFYF